VHTIIIIIIIIMYTLSRQVLLVFKVAKSTWQRRLINQDAIMLAGNLERNDESPRWPLKHERFQHLGNKLQFDVQRSFWWLDLVLHLQLTSPTDTSHQANFS